MVIAGGRRSPAMLASPIAVAHWAAAGVVPDRVVASLRTVVRERLLRLRAARRLLWSKR